MKCKNPKCKNEISPSRPRKMGYCEGCAYELLGSHFEKRPLIINKEYFEYVAASGPEWIGS